MESNYSISWKRDRRKNWFKNRNFNTKIWRSSLFWWIWYCLYESLPLCLCKWKKDYKAVVKSDKDLIGILVVNKTSGITQINDLKDKKFLFPSPNALAATLLTKYELLKNYHINIEKDEKFDYVNSHDSVYKGISRGIGDVGGGIERTFNALSDEKTKESLMILYKTQPYPSHPIAFNKSISKEVEKSLLKH